MTYYKNISEHVELLVEGLSKKLGVEITDKESINLDKGKLSLCYILGDIEPDGYNEIGQELNTLEMEIQIYTPISKTPNPQLYCASLSAKLIGLLVNGFYGLDDQRAIPVIEANAALKTSFDKKGKGFVCRSIIFNQQIKVGEPYTGIAIAKPVIFVGVQSS